MKDLYDLKRNQSIKTLVIKMLTELVEFVRKLDEKMKPMPRETKENVQGTNSCLLYTSDAADDWLVV